MSFLTPFYIAGLLALSLPILFHFIRRSPRGQLAFSSLMFLRPSPPRLTRRSRLDQILLLVLRALALCLLALAFARPFLRQEAQLDILTHRGRRVAILVDTSASMRRGDLWTQAVEKVREALADLGPTDDVALFVFDDHVRSLADFGAESTPSPPRRAALFERRLREAGPSWGGTDLGAALATVADRLEGFNDSKELDASMQMVLVSDLQLGSRLGALQTYEWPAGLRLRVATVDLPPSTNAGLEFLSSVDDPGGEAGCRVRVHNAAEAQREQFHLSWTASSAAPLSQAHHGVYVPPGESRVAHVPPPDDLDVPGRLVLTGDDHDFDNVLYVVPRRREEVTVKYIGPDDVGDPSGMGYYLNLALSSDLRHDVKVVSQALGEPLARPGERPVRLVVATGELAAPLRRQLRVHIEAGGTVLYVLGDALSAQSLAGILYDDPSAGARLAAREATGIDYAMLSEVDFTHPLFRPFADPRFSDFAKIHFWKYRQVTMDDGPSGRVLARFDGGDPALFERTLGRGRLLVLTSGWHPGDSQLALSSKFVPLVGAMLDGNSDGRAAATSYRVHEQVALPEAGAADGSAPARTVRRPDGSEVQLPEGADTFGDADEPGVYLARLHGREWHFAVNVAPEETRTSRLELEKLEQHGVRLGTQAEEADRQRQLRDLELERRQKLWRWLIAGALAVLIVETWLAGYLSRALPGKSVVSK